MSIKNVFAALMIIVTTLFLSGCDLTDLTDLTEPDDFTGDLELILDPASGTDKGSYHIEIDFEIESYGSIESLYWQISTTSEYDEDEWQEATTCWFLCDYVIDIEDVEDGDYYVHFKVDTSEGTEYVISDDTYMIVNSASSIDVVLDPSRGLGDTSYHVEIDLPNENVGTIENVYWQISKTDQYDETVWQEATTCWLLCDYVIDIENADDGEYFIHFKVVTSDGTEYLISDNTYMIMQEEYSIRFNSNGGTSVTTISQEYGSTVYEPNDPFKEGFEFEGWYTDAALSTLYGFSTMPLEDITLYAKWTAIEQYTITIDPNGGEVESTTVKVNEGDHLLELPVASYSGYEFVEWSMNGEAITLPIAVYDDITVVATYRRLEPHEVLYDYYKEHYPQEYIIDQSDEDYIEIITEDPRFEVTYTLSGKYYHFYYNESKDDILFMIIVDLVNSTIRCEANDGEYYERDFLYTYYDGNISLRDYEILEGYFEDVTSLVGGSTLQQELNHIYGYGLELSDFNPNWDALDALPETSYETHILDTIEQVTIDVYSVELSASGDEYILYYEITNNSDENITFMWLKTEYLSITGVIGEDYYFWNGELDRNTTIYFTKVVPVSSISEWYGNTLNYILDVAIE